MPSAKEWVEYFYPFLFDGADARYVPPSEMDMALVVALDFRPACLTEDRQNQAQAHYAAYVVEFRARTKAAGIQGNVTATVAGPIIEKREGDTSVKYATSANAASSSAIRDQLTGPGTPYAAWRNLWEICSGATVDGQLPVRRGAIITGFG